jgi:hypothetical protein
MKGGREGRRKGKYIYIFMSLIINWKYLQKISFLVKIAVEYGEVAGILKHNLRIKQILIKPFWKAIY